MHYFFIAISIIAGLIIIPLMFLMMVNWVGNSDLIQGAYIWVARLLLRRPAPRINAGQAREIARDWLIARGYLNDRFTELVPDDAQKELLPVYDGPRCWTVTTARSVKCFIVKIDNQTGDICGFEDLSRLAKHSLFAP